VTMHTHGTQRSKSGFTLVELLVVVGIMLALLGTLGVALAGSSGQRARQGAINLVLNTFEQARVAALENGTDVYVAFADGDLVGVEDEARYRTFIVFRDRTSSDQPPAGAGVSRFVFLTDWKRLPRGVSFKSESNSIVNRARSQVVVEAEDGFPRVAAGQALPALIFNASGAVRAPATGPLQLFLYEGYFNGSTDVVTGGAGSGLFERFELARFTGRIRHEVSTL